MEVEVEEQVHDLEEPCALVLHVETQFLPSHSRLKRSQSERVGLVVDGNCGLSGGLGLSGISSD